MNQQLIKKIDELIEKYKHDHKGELPLYVVLSPEETKALRAAVKEKEKTPEDHIISSYRDVTISEHPSLLEGNIYVSNELPETGS